MRGLKTGLGIIQECLSRQRETGLAAVELSGIGRKEMVKTEAECM
jgi:hypothetical protein